ncbi:MAG: glutaredoxin domain-containing protein [bacterium]
MARRMTRWLMCASALALVACTGKAELDAAVQATATVLPAPTRVAPGQADVLLRYRGDGDTWETATTIDEVPAASRGAVQVVDLRLSPRERAASIFIQIADLRAPGPDGAFPTRFVPRDQLEAALAAAEEAARPTQAPVTMYSASWCGVCRKAKAFMEKNGIAFVEKDIEKDKDAAAELSAKARRAGLEAGGVPVFDVGGRMMSGFDPETLLHAVRGS